ncbi:preprotein translocase subunit SecA [Candidatus Woesebacteria bacterium RIFCSPLOWO2_01_FULL_39_23]|uniref:Protein translocase subunit SecA n=1 Tax=Candidatus Woesebacteria bacterium RIFCSPHIGHO2_01_FULL_40_22 TaxID=1802499 RepID=A0A1F7YIR4_9BACT|nr:MAG: preprotein translocase subunit SecA [Candidatus Woesebacteria bacterium RBG_16_40_11]OGM26498.1 MAG: preprotein translocase subunit SecA [Candidatus Woesebacteria bacterium RIFCSPHIGHO2_01_FULL_40_22]OGM62951.1 MAG: preprotein translocase subunit SecA [Candidatus Woesebacteria bacterium RIFCSPLOWO2_01_FULL_39_23]
MLKLFSKFLDVNQKEIDKLQKTVDKINTFSDKTGKLKDEDFAKKTEEFKKRFTKGETLDDILPEAFALVREAAWRRVGMRPYDVQMMAGIALYQGKVAEQKTGEGKTLSAVPALYLRALTGKGAHLVTVNDYLARRDAGWNAPIFSLLGMSVGAIVQEMKSYVFDSEYNDTSHGDERLAHLKPVDRKVAYSADITYGTNNEFGFDYLRDNMVSALSEMAQSHRSGGTSGPEGEHYFAIVDEVDSILIDEARTPLIISAPDTEPTDKYYKFASLVSQLNPDTDFTMDEKSKSASLTEHGITRVEKVLGVDNLYEKDFDAIHHIENALRATTLYLRDREYVVKDNQVIIVDEFTGRLMFGRRWSDGLHQAVEAKEGVKIQQESKTLATISFQNYFRMYDVLSGMTGTAATEAEEFKKIYDIDVIVVPTHREMVRKDNPDAIYKTLRGKYGAIVKEIEDKNKKGQPVLVGTTSIEKNEIIDDYLKRKRIPHNVLNAKNHEKEATIIADAGKPGAVTVATNMAGRGVDIVLGGSLPDKPEGMTNDKWQKSAEIKRWKDLHEKVVKAGGLHVIGTERHESRRIDNQLRGRSGRQGDPGSSRFYLSLEDDLMRIFGGEQIGSLMDRLHLPEDQPIENRFVSKAIESAQSKVEGFHFDARKSLVEYDDVKNQQREIIYNLRRRVLESDNLHVEINEKISKEVDVILAASADLNGDAIDYEKLVVGLSEIVPFDDASRDRVKKEALKIGQDGELKEFLDKVVKDVYGSREKQVGVDVMRQIEKFAYLGAIDHMWIDHLDNIDSIEDAVKLRGYGQRDPLAEFKNEAFGLFEGLIDRIDQELSRRIFRIGVSRIPQPEIPISQARTNVDQLDQTGLAPAPEDLVAQAGEPAYAEQSINNKGQSVKKKIGRNDPCPCGSGKKYKKCHYPQYG